MLYHCRMWCCAIGVEAVVLRSWCVILCTVCLLVSNMQRSFMRLNHNKIICIKLVHLLYLQLILFSISPFLNSGKKHNLSPYCLLKRTRQNQNERNRPRRYTKSDASAVLNKLSRFSTHKLRVLEDKNFIFENIPAKISTIFSTAALFYFLFKKIVIS